MKSIWIGFDPREAAAFAVARKTTKHHTVRHIGVNAIVLDEMRERGLYTRPTSRRDGKLWDDISEAPMATEFAIARFLAPHLAGEGLALFMDCDVMVRSSLAPLFEYARAHREFAVLCVQHDHQPPEGVKMDGQVQTRYQRKNWSSVMLFNCEHPANKRLTVEMINTVPGRDLHRFCWLEDHEIGAISPEWNYLVGHTQTENTPAIVHFTDGIPSMPGYEDAPFADEWRAQLAAWAR
jgi:phage terminase large subunit-like protein